MARLVWASKHASEGTYASTVPRLEARTSRAMTAERDTDLTRLFLDVALGGRRPQHSQRLFRFRPARVVWVRLDREHRAVFR
jgi:hypothetical protein